MFSEFSYSPNLSKDTNETWIEYHINNYIIIQQPMYIRHDIFQPFTFTQTTNNNPVTDLIWA